MIVNIQLADGLKCARCWRHQDSVGKNAYFPEICERCVVNIFECSCAGCRSMQETK